MTRAMGDIGRPPRVQLIVNAAVASKCADVALAAGGAPVMGCTTAEEARECASKVDVTLLNFGTPTTEEIANAVVDARAVVVDPVGAGLGTRGGVIERWLTRRRAATRAARAEGDDGYKTWVKGNRSEMEALVRMFFPDREGFTLGAEVSATPESVESAESASAAQPAETVLRELAMELDMEIVCTGRTDFVVGKDEEGYVLKYAGDDDDVVTFGRFSGAGCCLGAVLAVKAASGIEPGVVLKEYRVHGKRAEAKSNGTGSFQVNFLDELCNAGTSS